MPTFNISNKYGSLPVSNATIISAGIVQLASTLVSNDNTKVITPSVLFNDGVSFLSGQMNSALSAGYGSGSSGYVLPYATTSVAGGVVLASSLIIGDTSAVVTPSLFINSGTSVLSASMNTAISGTPYNASVTYTNSQINGLSATYGVPALSTSMNVALSSNYTSGITAGTGISISRASSGITINSTVSGGGTSYNYATTSTTGVVQLASTLLSNDNSNVITPFALYTNGTALLSTSMNQALSAGYGTGAGGMVWSTISGNTLATNNHGYSVDLTNSSITLSAPTSATDGYQFGFRALTNGTSNTLTIARNGANIEGSANDMVFDVADSGGTYVYNTAQGWCLTTDIGRNVSGSTGGGTGGSAIGYKTLYIPASQMFPRSNNGCSIGSYESTSAKIHLETLDFDPDLTQYAQFSLVMPEDWDLSAVKTKFNWFADTGAGNVVWAIQGRGVSNGEAIDSSFGTAVSAIGSLSTLLYNQMTSATPAMTVNNNVVLGDTVQYQVFRDATNGSDTLSGNARLIGAWIQYYGSVTPTAW